MQCAVNEPGGGWGYGICTHVATAGVVALAVYLLSVEVGDDFRTDPEGVAVAIRRYILENAYARLPGGDEAIWNLLGDPLP